MHAVVGGRNAKTIEIFENTWTNQYLVSVLAKSSLDTLKAVILKKRNDVSGKLFCERLFQLILTPVSLF
jgi:hypothetical protein